MTTNLYPTMDNLCLVCEQSFVHGRYSLPDGTGYCSAACEIEAYEVECIPTTRSNRMINNRMGTLNRQMGILNRYRNQGIL